MLEDEVYAQDYLMISEIMIRLKYFFSVSSKHNSNGTIYKVFRDVSDTYILVASRNTESTFLLFGNSIRKTRKIIAKSGLPIL